VAKECSETRAVQSLREWYLDPSSILSESCVLPFLFSALPAVPLLSSPLPLLLLFPSPRFLVVLLVEDVLLFV
jgi:hypothetical protein